jgi:hypothetical protein
MDTTEHWLSSHTFHHRQFADTAVLLERKQAQSCGCSLCIPTLNEEHNHRPGGCGTAAALAEIRSLWLMRIAVIDSGSQESNPCVGRQGRAEVYLASEILPEAGHYVRQGRKSVESALSTARGHPYFH